MGARDGRRMLIAGLGNIFLSDDGFGVEVARRLLAMALPPSAVVADFGIRGVHLAYALLEGGYDTLILIDALPHGAAPGTVTVIEPETDAAFTAPEIDGHDLHPAAVLRLLHRLGGPVPRVLVVGCEPASVDEGMGLSPVVAAAVEPAARAIEDLVRREETAHVSGDSGTDCRTVA